MLLWLTVLNTVLLVWILIVVNSIGNAVDPKK